MTPDHFSLRTSTPPVDRLRALLTLESGDAPNEFWAPSEWMVGERIFGGQLLGQSVAAASKALPKDRPPTSMHTMFLLAGDVTTPVRYVTEILHSGRSFSQCQVSAFQHDRTLARSLVCAEVPGGGVEHQQDPAEPLGTPDDAMTDSAALAASTLPGAQEAVVAMQYRAFDTRHRPNSVYISADPAPASDRQLVWMRTRGAFPGDQAFQRAALAYASDYTILEPGMRRHGISWSHPGLTRASLDHAIWFHRNVHVDQWCAYTQHSPSAQHGRSLSVGSIFNETGQLLATCAQEGVLRIPEVS